jgi:hypothetical protein
MSIHPFLRILNRRILFLYNPKIADVIPFPLNDDHLFEGNVHFDKIHHAELSTFYLRGNIPFSQLPERTMQPFHLAILVNHQNSGLIRLLVSAIAIP